MSNTVTETSKTNSTTRDIHQEVTNLILTQLEKGTVPWKQPWKGTGKKAFDLPVNSTSKNHYRGINILLLWGSSLEKQYTSSEWASFKQWTDKNEIVRKGEKGTMVVYYDVLEKEENDEIRKIPYLKTYYVFNRCQLNSYDSETMIDEPVSKPLVERIQAVDSFVENTQAIIEHGNTGAFYRPSEDKINMPSVQAFIDTDSCTATEGYYSTLLHELVHWSGSPKRLDRTKGKKFGDNEYAVEELVAELGAAFLCAEFDIGIAEKGDHANYIASWMKVLKENKYAIISAASEASKAVGYMKSIELT